jgi:hypothetical protein
MRRLSVLSNAGPPPSKANVVSAKQKTKDSAGAKQKTGNSAGAHRPGKFLRAVAP